MALAAGSLADTSKACSVKAEKPLLAPQRGLNILLNSEFKPENTEESIACDIRSNNKNAVIMSVSLIPTKKLPVTAVMEKMCKIKTPETVCPMSQIPQKSWKIKILNGCTVVSRLYELLQLKSWMGCFILAWYGSKLFYFDFDLFIQTSNSYWNYRVCFFLNDVSIYRLQL